MKIKCERCGKIFKSKTIKKRYCDECIKKKRKESKLKYDIKKYWNDDEFKSKKKRYRKDKKQFLNRYGLLLGTTDFGSHRKKSFNDEFRLVRKEKRKVLSGNTYTSHKYIDLFDNQISEIKDYNVYNPNEVSEIVIPKDLNNFQEVEKVQNYIIKHFHIKTNEIYGTLKIELPHFDKYILFCKVNGKVTENCIYTPKNLYV